MNTKDEIIRKYCGSIEERINACFDRKVAELLKEQICLELKRGAQDQQLVTHLKEQVDRMINEKFSISQ